MGIYDREYLRDESAGSGLFGGVSQVTKSIIALGIGTFLVQNLLHLDSNDITRSWLMASPGMTFHNFRLFQLVTAAFVHVGIWQLVFDLYFFWMVGREMEAMYGPRDFLIFVLVSAVLSTLAGLIVAVSAGVYEPFPNSWGPTLAVMTLYTLYYPRREILFFFFIPMPMWVLLSIYLVVPFLGHFGGGSPGVDLGIVLVAAGFAYLYKQLDLRWSRLFSGRVFRPRLRIFTSVGFDQARPRSQGPSRSTSSIGSGRAPAVSVLPEEQLDARLDEILAKIARDGNSDGLTEEEQRVLQEASRRARIRRSDRI